MKKFVTGLCSCIKKGYARLGIALAVAFASVCAFAEGGAATAYDMSIISDISGKLDATLTSFWTNQKEVILTVVGLIVVFSLIWLVAKLWKRGTSKA